MHAFIAWFTPAHVAWALGILGTVCSILTGLLSSRSRLVPVLGAVMRIAGRVSVLTHPDAPGTFKWPLVAAAVAREVADLLDPPKPAAPKVPLPILLVLALLLVGCSGSWEQRTHRALVATAHLTAAVDTIAADRYHAAVVGLDAGAEFDRIDGVYHRIQGAEAAISAALVRAEALLDQVGDAGASARCATLHAMLGLLSDINVLRGTLIAAGVDVPVEALHVEGLVAAAVEEMLPTCGAADAGAVGG